MSSSRVDPSSSIVLDDAHEHVWKRIGHVADMVVLDRCTVAGCGAEHYYDPHVEPPRRYELVSTRWGAVQKGRCGMNVLHRTTWFTLSAAGAVAVLALAGFSSLATAQDAQVTLSGVQEVPAVSTSAAGSSTISVSPDKSVSGSVTTSGMAGTVAHIHTAAAGQNGPVIIPLTKSGDNMWSVPPGTKLTDAQYESFKAGNLYVNVHSAAYPGGEVRGQLQMMMGMTPTEQRGTGTSMTNPVGVDGNPITTFSQPRIERGTGTSMTNPVGVDGNPITTTTNFGQR